MHCFSAIIGSLGLAAIAVSAALGQAPTQARRGQLNDALSEDWEYQLKAHPELATHSGDNRYNDRLSDYSAKFIAEDLKHSEAMLARIEAIDASDFPEAEKVSKALMVRSLREEIESARFKDWEMPATQFGGPHLEYAGMPSETSFRSVKDYEDYLSRLHQLPKLFEQVTENMRLGLREHLMPPKYLLEKVAAQAQKIADDSLEASPFSQPVLK